VDAEAFQFAEAEAIATPAADGFAAVFKDVNAVIGKDAVKIKGH